jgi:formate hydrogenlyase subunit 4
MEPISLLPPLLALALAPLMLGIINRVKAVVAGRQGPPLFQAYFDLVKLMGKSAVYSTTASWVVRAGPTVGLAAAMTASALVPMGPVAAPLAFPGDLVLFAYLLALMRFATVVASLDPGSSFEGMGASREVFFAVFAEPALLLGLLVAARGTGSLSLSGLLGSATLASVAAAGPAILLVAVAIFLVLLVETARIPFDDPNTHLELTMIHEAMVLDHGGPDLAYITYGAALKLWLLSAVLVGLIVPAGELSPVVALPVYLISMALVAALIGLVESTTARVRLVRAPRLLVGAGGLAALALLLVLF